MTLGPIKILFVEADVSEQVHVERFIRGFADAYRLHAVGNTHAAVNCLRHARYDVVLIDYRFSDGTIFDLLDELGETPSIFLTEDGQEEIAAMALKRGAYDYIMKDTGQNYLMLLPGTIQKVMNRRRAEEALRQSEARCRDLMDLMLDLYFCVSEEGSILLANRSGAGQLGYTVHEVMGLPLQRLVHPSDVDALKHDLLVASSMPEQSRPARFRLMRKDGIPFLVTAEIRAQPERGRQIPVIRMVCRGAGTTGNGKAPAVSSSISNGAGILRPDAVTASNSSAAVATAVAEPKLAPREVAGHERLLIVDDEPDQRALSARLLAKLGYRVVTAENGHAAIELMKAGRDDATPERSPFDLVLLDMSMEPGFNGLETYQEMLKLFPKQRCIIVSGCCEYERVRKAQSLGAGELVSKPYTVEALARAVRGEIDRNGEKAE